MDTFIGDGDYVNGPVKFPLSFIASDNKLGGVIACNALAESIGKKGKIYIQNVKRGISSTDAREEGCKEAIKAYPDVKLVGVDYNDDDPSKAQAQVEAMLQKTPDLGGIFGTNVFSAQGAGTVVKNKGLSGKVKVVAFDATADAINMLKGGTVGPRHRPEAFGHGLPGGRDGRRLPGWRDQHPEAHPDRLCGHHPRQHERSQGLAVLLYGRCPRCHVQD